MELFKNAKTIRLVSHHDKYLVAEDDEKCVSQSRDGTSRNANWGVVNVVGGEFVRFKSCYGKYLTASDMPFLPGLTGHKVLQTRPAEGDSSADWEALRDGFQVRLRARRGGRYLRPNGGVPPWRNSVTHDHPRRPGTRDKVLWDVEIMEAYAPNPNRMTLYDLLVWEAQSQSPSSAIVSLKWWWVDY